MSEHENGCEVCGVPCGFFDWSDPTPLCPCCRVLLADLDRDHMQTSFTDRSNPTYSQLSGRW